MNTKKVTKALTSLENKVSILAESHPKSSMAGGAGVAQAEIQLPWICRTLNEAAEALDTNRDPFGNPITPSQVVSGLRQLTAYVRDPSYGTLMEMVYPGVDKPLQGCMDELDKIIQMID